MDLNLESITIGYVFKMQFFLPGNASNYLNPLADPFDLTTQPITGINRKRRFLEVLPETESPQDAIDKNDNSKYKGFDNEQNEWYERHQVEAEIEVENGTQTSNDSEKVIDNGLWIDQQDAYDNIDQLAQQIPQYQGTTRFSLYKGIAAVADRLISEIIFVKSNNKLHKKSVVVLFNSKGLSGKACVLRSICESAHTPFDYSNGILSEMMHVIMT